MRKLSQKEIQALCEAYRNTGSLREVGRKFSRSQNTVGKYVSKFYKIKTKDIITHIKTNNELLKGLYVGLWLGDGTQYFDRRSYVVKICGNKNDKLLNKVIYNLIYRLFGKKAYLIEEKNTNRAYIRLHSKFIFHYIFNYVQFKENKTYSVKLKGGLNSYSDNFLKGCLLGLALSDGSLKERFVFGVTSKGLALNMKAMLLKFQFSPYMRLQNRPNKATFYTVTLSPKESRYLQEFLSAIIHSIGYDYSFYELKYGPGRI